MIRTGFCPRFRSNIAEAKNKIDVRVKPSVEMKYRLAMVSASKPIRCGSSSVGLTRSLREKVTFGRCSDHRDLTMCTSDKTIRITPTKNAVTCAVHGESMIVVK